MSSFNFPPEEIRKASPVFRKEDTHPAQHVKENANLHSTPLSIL